MKLLGFILLGVALAETPSFAGAIQWSGPQNIEMGAGWPPGQGGIGNVYVDFDQDGATDCRIQNRDGIDWYAMPLSGPNGQMNEITAEDRGLGLRCWPLDYGTELGPTLPGEITWHGDEEPLIEWRISGGGEYIGIGTWAYATNRYMGVRFGTGEGSIHYGWIQMTVFGDRDAAIVHDWAWNTTPGEGLWAGQVPEPSTYLLFALGALTMAFAARHRIRRRGSAP